MEERGTKRERDGGQRHAGEPTRNFGPLGRLPNGGKIRTFSAGYDREEPSVSARSGCRWMRITISDASPLHRLVVRIDRRVVRRTTRKRLRLRVHPGQRVSVTAVDAAGNPARVRTTVPPC
jgi:hypothetical protein